MKMKWLFSFSTLALILVSTGCTSPRLVRADKTSVIIAVPEDTDEFPHYYKSEAAKIAKTHINDAEFFDATKVKEGALIQASGTQPVKPGEVRPGEVAKSTSDKVEYYLEYRSKSTMGPLSTKPMIRVGTGDPNAKPETTTLPPTTIGGDLKIPERRPVPPITNPAPIQNNFPSTGGLR